MKKIICLIIEGTYPWYIGGVSEWVFRYIETLADFNFHIMQISTDDYHRHDLNKAVYPIPDNVIKFTRLSMPPAEEFRISVLKEWADSLIKDTSACKETNFIHVTNTGFAGLFGLTLSKTYQLNSSFFTLGYLF